jgi:hypothetical protein
MRTKLFSQRNDRQGNEVHSPDKHSPDSILAHAKAGDSDTLAHAAASEINLLNGALPRDVQWMPPGRQTVQPLGFDEPFEMHVTPAIARRADAQLQELRSAAAAGRDVEPYLDFNHKDEGRAFKPTRFYWAGEDPKAGGIRAEGAWTGAGAKAVLDGELCCVSASWVLHKTTKEFLGIKHNVGGLVPRSAFHSIQAFAKADSSNQNPQTKTTMTDQEIQAAITNGITAGLKPYAARLDTLEANAKPATTAAAPAHASAADITTAITKALEPLQQEVKALKDSNANNISANAKATVETIGIRGGRIGAQDKDAIDYWTKAIAADAKAADVLAKITPNPAFVQIVNAGSAGGHSTATTGEHEFIARAKAHGEANKITDALDAQAAYARTVEGRKLYTDYCESLAPHAKK